MKTIVPFPSIDFMNHFTHDFKAHYRYARGYQELVMDTLKADVNGIDLTPHFVENDEYKQAGGILCSSSAV